jgi:hypothetical protein
VDLLCDLLFRDTQKHSIIAFWMDWEDGLRIFRIARNQKQIERSTTPAGLSDVPSSQGKVFDRVSRTARDTSL